MTESGIRKKLAKQGYKLKKVKMHTEKMDIPLRIVTILL